MNKRIFKYAVQLILITFSFQLGAQRTALFNYLNKQTTLLTSTEQTRLNQIWGSEDYDNYELATLNSISTSFLKSTVIVNMPNKIATFKVDNATTNVNNDFYWMGATENIAEGGVFTLASNSEDGYLGSVNFQSEDLFYQIFPLSPTKVVITTVKPIIFKSKWNCGTITTAPSNDDENADETETRSSCPTRNIRVLILFTTRAAGSGLVPATVASSIISELNTTTSASALPSWEIRFELAATLPLTTFVESTSGSDDIDDLVNHVPAINLRASNLADLVILLTNAVPYDVAGIAGEINTNFSNAFAIAQIRPASTGFTATHEIGHLLGGRHQRCSTCGGIWGSPIGFTGCDEFTLGHGYGVGPTLRTIMYQNGCDSRTRIGRWSNPDRQFSGFDTGNYWNKNARRLKNNAGKVACFFDSPIVVNTNMVVGISGPNGPACGQGIWYANITNNPGTLPYNYIWELSENGISDWIQIGGNTQSLSEVSILNAWPASLNCGDSFFIRVRVSDSSSPQLYATNSKQLTAICCVQGGNSEPRNTKSNYGKKLYPNPTTGFFYYKLSQLNFIKIYNISGQLQKSETERISDDYIWINLGNLSSGIYIIQESDANSNKSMSKIIKI